MRQNYTRSVTITKSNASTKDQPVIGVSSDAQPIPVKGDVEYANAARSRSVGLRMELAKSRARYDRPGHLADAHAERLRHSSRGRPGRDEFTLVFDLAAADDLATELAEQAVTS